MIQEDRYSYYVQDVPEQPASAQHYTSAAVDSSPALAPAIGLGCGGRCSGLAGDDGSLGSLLLVAVGVGVGWLLWGRGH